VYEKSGCLKGIKAINAVKALKAAAVRGEKNLDNN